MREHSWEPKAPLRQDGTPGLCRLHLPAPRPARPKTSSPVVLLAGTPPVPHPLLGMPLLPP